MATQMSGPELAAWISGQYPIFNWSASATSATLLWTPAEAFAQGHPADPALPQELSVISWTLLQTLLTRD